MFMLWHQIRMEKITTFICAINFTCLLNVSLFCLRITYTKGKFHPRKSIYTKYIPEDKTQANLQNLEKFEAKHPHTFRRMYQFWVCQAKSWPHPEQKIFNFVEKSIFLRFLHEDAGKVTKQTRDKHKGLNPCCFVT